MECTSQVRGSEGITIDKHNFHSPNIKKKKNLETMPNLKFVISSWFDTNISFKDLKSL